MQKTFINSLGMRFVLIDQGSFMMGQDKGGESDERPVHRVNISRPFYMAVNAVTNAQYEQFNPEHHHLRGYNGFSIRDDEAVIFVSWNDTLNFCEWLSKKEGKTYRLPTEARGNTPVVLEPHHLIMMERSFHHNTTDINRWDGLMSQYR